MNQIKLFVYKTKSGKEPFYDWRNELDVSVRGIIRTRLDRIVQGNFGDSKQLKNAHGVWELRINFGPGLRIYYGKQGNVIVVLLCGGDKGSQNRDIEKAKKYWADYLETLS